MKGSLIICVFLGLVGLTFQSNLNYFELKELLKSLNELKANKKEENSGIPSNKQLNVHPQEVN